ncbi:MAG: cation:proton antiporter [Methanomassiliicoccaceae archaeon]|nr:cation:proton antiporter [Methanomassiliicoccaceae archaeon]
MDEISAIILQIFLLLAFAKVLGGIFERFKMPKLIGEIVAGLIFINVLIFYTPLQDLLEFHVDRFNDPNEVSFFHIMGELGIIFLLFGVGLETKFSDMMKVGKTAIYIAVLGVIIPFIGGFLFFLHESISLNAALLIGAALFGTSTAVGVECLRNMNCMNTNEAKLIVSATIIDDILCLALLGVIMGAVKPDADTVSIVINTVIVAVFVLFMFFFISRVKKIAARRRRRMQQRTMKKMQTDDPAACACDPEPVGELGALGLAVIVSMGLAALSVNIGLAAIIGAFLAGMIFAEFKDTLPVEHNFNVITYFLLPFFFIWVGMEVQFSSDRVTMNVLPMLCLVVAVAIVTKYVAGYIGARKGKLSKDSAHLIGVSFIPRGEVGIIVASIGLTYGVFSPDIFTVIILMALITSVIAPPLVSHAYRKIEKNRSVVFEELFPEKGKESDAPDYTDAELPHPKHDETAADDGG